MEIACCTDARFAPDCGVMLASLLDRNPDANIRVHLLNDESLSAQDSAALRSIVLSAGGSFTSVPVTSEPTSRLSHSERFPPRIWYRVLLGELLRDLDRVLYIDADALIAGPLSQLWETDLSGHVVGAVTNPLYDRMVPRVQSELGLPDRQSYFNSGVLLIDLQAWREEEIGRSVLRFAACHPGLIWPDQDALNGILHERRLPLQPRWNAMPGIWGLPMRYLPFPREEIRQARAAPAIVHFVGPHKPWHYRSRHPYRHEYFRYLNATPWRGREVEGRSPWQTVLRALPMIWAYRTEVLAARFEALLAPIGERLRAAARSRL